MPAIKKITQAKTTCDGLQRLIGKLNIAAVDLDKSGGSAYELIGLLASTQTCVSSLSMQLDEIASNTQLATEHLPKTIAGDTRLANDIKSVTPLHRQNAQSKSADQEPLRKIV